jgi:phage shock protein C
MNEPLYRSREDAMIGGVCGGLADYLGMDAILPRLFFILLAVAGAGIGALIYLLFWMIIPLDARRPQRGRTPSTWRENVQANSEEIAGAARAAGEDLHQMVRRPNRALWLLAGAALILVGVYELLQALKLPWLSWLNLGVVWPAVLIVGGLALLLRRPKGGRHG